MKSRAIKSLINETVVVVQELVDQEFLNCNGIPEPRSSLDQLGLKDGKEIIIDYLDHNEFGLALEHLVYMIEETEISLPQSTVANIREVSILLKLDIEI